MKRIRKTLISIGAVATAGLLLALASPRTAHASSEEAAIILNPANHPAVVAADGVKLIDHANVVARGGYPYHITEAGSYRLSSNLVVPSGANAINITVSNVTIDLNGFAISGSGSSAISGGSTPITGVSVRNGTISGPSSGINLGNCTGCSVQQMLIENSVNGISVGPTALVSSNVVTGFTAGSAVGTAIVAGVYSTIIGNTVSGPAFGIQAAANSSVSGNTVSNIYSVGILVDVYSTVSGNTATGSNVGIAVNCPVNLLGNTALTNAFGNIFYQSGSGCNSVNNLAP
jgi:hypothetical protein